MELKIAPDEMKPEYREIADIIGIEPFLTLVQKFGGLQMYIPKADSLMRNKRDEQIQAEFNGYNFRELAQKYGLTERYIRDIVSPVLKLTRSRPLSGQVCLFDEIEEIKD